jgi:hypothetical protein
VPNSCIKEDKRHFYVFLKRGGKIRKTRGTDIGTIKQYVHRNIRFVQTGTDTWKSGNFFITTKMNNYAVGGKLRIAVNSLRDHKSSHSDMLGIIFGTASVIAMISIGRRFKKHGNGQYQDLGVEQYHYSRLKTLPKSDLERSGQLSHRDNP